MAKKPVLNAKPQHSVPPELAKCIEDAQSRCADARSAERAFSALEKFLLISRSGKFAGQMPDEHEVKALLALVRQEAARRMVALREAVECLSAAKDEELARRRDEGLPHG